MNDIVSKWKDENTLPPDADSELQRNSAIVLDQLQIVRKVHQSHGQQVDDPQPGPSVQKFPKLQKLSKTTTKESKVHLLLYIFFILV